MAAADKSRTGILIILDGFGLNPSKEHNAIAQAETPTLNRLFRDYPWTQIDASESHVGLPNGFMGNSEVGHLNIGAGRIVYQDFSLISKAIEDESFFDNPAISKLMSEVKLGKKGATLHLMGLVSDGGVHSHSSHLFALLRMAKTRGMEKVAIHVFTDGRDTSPTSGLGFVEELERFCQDVGIGKIETVMGRFYAMDRDNRWERTEAAYRAITMGVSDRHFSVASQAVREQYETKATDEFLVPATRKGYAGVQDGDGILFFNFRADRARQLTRAMTQTDFAGFKRTAFPTLAGFVCMTPYDESFKLPTAFEKPKVPNTIGKLVSEQGWKQIRIAETEKYAHVTYFFNGGDETTFPGEKRILVPSPREVKTYDLKPEMSAVQVCEQLLKELSTEEYRFAVVNFANPDMVGHTGNLRAAIKAVETVDGCLQKIVQWVEKHDAFAILTADHGNCEKMLDDSGRPLTSHTLLPVPFILIDPQRKESKLASHGKLCDIAPSILSLWGLQKPAEMTGKSLVALL